ncbi:MAG: type VI-B CRISPR-associated RNA-guided ribonuclease Cas13b, partial [Flavobacterium sp.]
MSHNTKDDASLVDYEKFISLLSDYFPIIREVDQINHINDNGEIYQKTKKERVEDFKEIALLLIDSIDKLRNFYTHFHHEPISIESKLFSFLDNVLLKTVLDTKKNYLKDDHTKEMIKDSLKEDFDKIFKLKIDEYLKQDNNTSKKIRSAKKRGNDFSDDLIKEITGAIYNDSIKYFLYDNGKKAELNKTRKTTSNEKDSFYKGKDFDLPISSSGIIFLLSCFLNRKEVEDLKANIKGYKGKVIKTEEPTLEINSIRFMTTHRIYSYWCYKGLKNKIKTSENATKETLLMQMIDELSKVPNVIYQNISEKLKESFIEDWNEYYKDNEEKHGNYHDSKVVHPVVRKRYEDKFNYFAIRFLDEFVDFPSLRFQVHLGNYLVHSMPKQNANVITEREIKKKIFVFGKLSEINQLKSDFFQQINEEDIETNWEFFPNPNYHFPRENTDELKTANKIGIYLNGINIKLDEYKSQANKKSSLDKFNLIEQITRQNQAIKTGQPLAYLSMNDIHSVVFEALENPVINKNRKIDGKNIEEKIKRKLNQQINEILTKDSEAKIIKNQLKKEEELINFTKLIKDINEELRITKNLIEVLEERKKMYEAYQKVKGKKNVKIEKRNHILYNEEKGQIATWLANDIKRFFPKNFKENWKGHQHSEFQLSIAFYDTQKQNIISLLNGFDYKKEIPMIDFSTDTFVDFYENYLIKRKIELKNLLNLTKQSQETDQVNIDVYFNGKGRIFKKVNYQNKSIDNKIKTILSNPIFIERGFMDDKPTILPNTSLKDNEHLFAYWFVAFKKFNNYQNFYNTSNYPLDIKNISKAENRKLNTSIYQQKKNDWLVWKMIQFVFKDIFKQDMQNVALAELYQSRAERLQNKENKKQNFIWNRTIDLQLNEKIHIPEVKLKDIGNFRKYDNDQRILTFLEYNDITHWMAYLPNDWHENHSAKPINVIALQIDEYEKFRQHDLLKEVQDLERYIYEKVDDKEQLKQDDNPNFKKYILHGLIKIIKSVNISNFKILSEETDFNKIDF